MAGGGLASAALARVFEGGGFVEPWRGSRREIAAGELAADGARLAMRQIGGVAAAGNHRILRLRLGIVAIAVCHSHLRPESFNRRAATAKLL